MERRYGRKEGEQNADFISCVAFGKAGEFAEKHLRKGTKVAIVGRIQTGSYTNRDGAKVYTTDVVVEEHEFAESKAASGNGNGGGQQTQGVANYGGYQGERAVGNDGFMNIPDGLDEELPFN